MENEGLCPVCGKVALDEKEELCPECSVSEMEDKNELMQEIESDQEQRFAESIELTE